ncbi:hypothetical protein NESM_000380800 [Novymonas esmeraldas]|uniref:Uncharacterized protein n=1 Tax=Novymonas esmeraldas TaxID=1808958 RepID=A0AAW0EMX0_9TRYP
MLRRRSLHAATTVATGVSVRCLHRVAPSAGDAALALLTPPDPVRTPARLALPHAYAVRTSRLLLAPRHSSSSSSSGGAAEEEEEERGPYDVTVDEVLLHPHRGSGSDGGGGAAVTTVVDLVRLLVDPDVAVGCSGGDGVEAVKLRDFAAMTQRRKLKAVGGDAETLAVLLSSERYQSEKDARELRLLGVATVGQWREQPDRVPLSPYARGLLEAAHNRLARHRRQSQRDEVVAWLTGAIQRAVADELMAPKRLSADGSSSSGGGPAPLVMDLKASVVAAAVAGRRHSTDAGETEEHDASTADKDDNEGEEEEDADEAAAAETVHTAARRRGARQRPVVVPESTATAPRSADGDDPADIAETAVAEVVAEVLQSSGEEVEDAEMARLMAEAEAILGRESPPGRSESVSEARSSRRAAPAAAAAATTAAAAAPVAATHPSPSAAAAAAPAGRHGGRRAHPAPPVAAAAEVEEAVEEDEEELVEEEEVEEEEEEEGHAESATKAASAAATAAAAPPPPAAAAASSAPATAAAAAEGSEVERRAKLVRLAELMLKQFNTADGYLHPTNAAEREAHERRGDILVLDDDTAQVDPLAMFSAYHAATVTDADPVGVRALKTIWTSYNKHQMALEEATDEAAIDFYKRESINALLYGSVLMRALAREEAVVVLEGTQLPPYGFPLVSSDTRPFSGAVASATDMTPGKVPTAMQAYKALFSSKERRYSPFRPGVDQSAGCSVVRLSGTTLHLYYTSTKDHIMEEEVRLPFAEVMLGVLHLLRHKVLPRVNVVHYHLIATKMADPSDSTDFMLRSTATIDLTNPFSKEELVRLRALATPLGMADEMDEYRCIDDIVMEIEETTGASIVHSLLHNREDLEATLTATLAQLLPEDGDVDGSAATATGDVDEPVDSNAGEEEVDEEEVEEEVVVAPPPPQQPQRRSKSSSSRRRAAQAEVEEDVEEEADEEEDNDVEAAAPPRGRQRQQASPPPPPPPPSRRSAHNTQTTAAAEVDDHDAAAEEEDEEYEEEEEMEATARPPPPPARAAARVSPAAAAAAASSPQAARATAAPRRAAAPVAAAVSHDADAVEEEEEEEEEEVMAPAPPPQRTAAGRRAVPASSAPPPPPVPPPPAPAVRRAQAEARHHAPPAAAAADDAEEEEEEADVPQVRTRRVVRRAAARTRTAAPPPPAAASFDEVVSGVPEAAAAAAQAAGTDDDDQWFRKRPKRRYFE